MRADYDSKADALTIRQRFSLDGSALIATARAALSAPDRLVEVHVAGHAVA
jgi:hypothetical protein